MSSDVRLPSLEGLQTFEVCARVGSFERAARELALTSSAVSKRVQGIEDVVAAPLFFRSGKSLLLTPIGREYLEDVRIALSQLTKIPLHQRHVQRLERLRVVSPPTFARHIIAPRITQFTRQHPELDVEVLISIPFLDIAPPLADISISFEAASKSSTKLLFEPVYAMATPSYLRSLGTLKMPADIGRGSLLRCPLEPWQPWFYAAGLSLPEPTAGPKMVDIGMTLEACAASQGIALGRRSLALNWLVRGDLVPVFPIKAQPIRGYCLATVNPSAGAVAFAQWIQSLCSQLEKDSRAA